MNAELQTIQASFRGVPFNIEVESHDGGRKVAVSEYPGSDTRFVEDLGKKPGTYRIQAYVSNGPVNKGPDQLQFIHQDDWLHRADRLTEALDNSSEGVLVLTTTGSITVKAVTYTKSLKQVSLGRVDFNITFLVSTPNPSPVRAPSSIYTVATALGRALDAALKWMEDSWIVPGTATEAAVADYDGKQHMGSISDSIQRLGQKTDTITAQANKVRNNISELTRDPIAYAAGLFNDGILGEVFKTVLTSRDALNSISKLCRVGYNLALDFETIKGDILTGVEQSFNIPKWGDDTRYRLTNNSNRFIITNSLRSGLFTIYLHQAADNDYPTDSDINAVIGDLNDVYENVILISGVTPALALAVDECRIEAINVLESKLITTPNIDNFILKTPTIDVELAYRLYAEEFESDQDLVDRAQALTDLNDILPNRFSDSVKVLKL